MQTTKGESNDKVTENAKQIFTITSLPATIGDCFWITFGPKNDLHYILVDGGTGTTSILIKALIKELPKGAVLDLVIVTHVDSDHIQGMLNFLSDDVLPIPIKQIWFNAYKHLDEDDKKEKFGAEMGENFSARIIHHDILWNGDFGGEAVKVPDDIKTPLPSIEINDGMTITLLSPYSKNLKELKPVWEAEIKAAGLVPGFGTALRKAELPKGIENFGSGINIFDQLDKAPFAEDTSKGNGSSIAFIAEFAGKRCLFAGDSFPKILVSSLDRISKNKISIDLLKISHHGGKKNTGFELLEHLACPNYLISTNAVRHPHLQTIAYILKRSSVRPTIYFNYASQSTKIWEKRVIKRKYKYDTKYPKNGNLVIDLLADEKELPKGQPD